MKIIPSPQYETHQKRKHVFFHRKSHVYLGTFLGCWISEGMDYHCTYVIKYDTYNYTHMGLSINGGTTKMMIYKGKPPFKWMIWGYPLFRKPPYGSYMDFLWNSTVHSLADHHFRREHHARRDACSSRCCKSLALSKRAWPRHWASLGGISWQESNDVSPRDSIAFLNLSAGTTDLKHLERCCCLLQSELNILLTNGYSTSLFLKLPFLANLTGQDLRFPKPSVYFDILN